MRSCGLMVIGQRDIYRAGLAATLRGSRFKVAREIDIDEGVLDGAFVNISSLIIIIEPKNHRENTKRVVASLRDRFSAVCIVVIPYEDNDRWKKEDGIDSCLPRTISSRALLLSLELILCREVAVGIPCDAVINGPAIPSLTRELQSSMGEVALSAREQEILSWLARGQSNKEIARALTIEEATVKAHVRTVLRKTGASNRTQAAMMAHAWLVSPYINSVHGAH